MSILYLTFDDGPNGGTSVVLDKLKAIGAVATFFLTGSNSFSDTKEKELIDRMLTEGHQIGSHCFVHKPMTSSEYNSTYGGLTDPAKRAAFKKNLTDNIAHFSAVTGNAGLDFPLVRLPGDGRFHTPSVKEVGKHGYTHIGWDFEFAPNGVLGHISHKDWKGITGVAATDAGLPKNNHIVLAHDHHWTAHADRFASLLKTLVDNGFQFKLIGPQLIA